MSTARQGLLDLDGLGDLLLMLSFREDVEAGIEFVFDAVEFFLEECYSFDFLIALEASCLETEKASDSGF